MRRTVIQLFLGVSLFLLNNHLANAAKLRVRNKQTSDQDKILLAIEVSRHGARSPQTVMPFNANDEQFKNTSNLLATGFFQH
jgi:hypothetical protein